jgi:hypothetical protein
MSGPTFVLLLFLVLWLAGMALTSCKGPQYGP